MSSPSLPETLQEAVEYFADPQNCHEFVVAMRWPSGVSCPTCARTDPRFIATRRLFECKGKHPKRQFSVKVGTIFEDSPIPLKKWLVAMWLIASCKNGVSSYEIHRAIKVTQKTAWFMLHRIRLAMQATGGGKLGGHVEVDETFIGGKARFMHKHKREQALRGRTGHAGKAAVMGVLERPPTIKAGPANRRPIKLGTSKVRVMPVQTTRRGELSRNIEQHVEDGAHVYTDELASYDNLGLYYQHQVINHAQEYARGEVHTNGMENFWSLLKRSIKGTYVSVEPFHLFRYLDEQAFRFNERGGDDAERFTRALSQIVGRRLTYDGLIARSEEARA